MCCATPHKSHLRQHDAVATCTLPVEVLTPCRLEDTPMSAQQRKVYVPLLQGREGTQAQELDSQNLAMTT